MLEQGRHNQAKSLVCSQKAKNVLVHCVGASTIGVKHKPENQSMLNTSIFCFEISICLSTQTSMHRFLIAHEISPYSGSIDRKMRKCLWHGIF